MSVREPSGNRSLAWRAIVWSLGFYPRSYRERDLDGMKYCLENRLREARERGWISTWLFCVRTLVHAFFFGLLARLTHSPRPAHGSHRRRKGKTMGGLLEDFGFASRSLVRNPGISLVIVLVLAVGIGANTAVFSLVDSILLRPLPFPEPERLMMIAGSSPDQGLDQIPLSYPDFKEVQRLNESFSGLAAFWRTPLYFLSGESSGVWDGALVSAGLPEMLGVQPLLGRSFREEESAAGHPQVTLIGEGLWRRQYGGDPGVLGQTVVLNDRPSTIVGVLPEAFRFPDNAEAWVLLTEDRLGPRSHKHLSLVGRLAIGASPDQASDDLARIASGLAERHPETNGDIGFRASPLEEMVFGKERRPVLLFYLISCLTLLIACANAANLMLARNMSRTGELAVRASLGAGRRRLTQFVLAESLLLASAGGALGACLGFWGRDLILTLRGVELPFYAIPEFDFGSLLVIAGIVVGSGLVAGLIPSITVARSSLRGALRSENGRVEGTRGMSRLVSALVSVEVALALAVLVGTNMMVKSALRQRSMDPGFEMENVETLRLRISGRWDSGPAERWQFYKRVLEEIRSLPSVSAASIVSQLPSDYRTDPWPIRVEEDEMLGRSTLPQYLYRYCENDYFSTMGIPLLQGRLFEEGETPVAVVSAEFARLYWPGKDPLGKKFAFENLTPDDEWLEVVGVVGDTRNVGYGRSVEPAVFLPFSVVTSPMTHVVARTESEGNPIPMLTERIRSVDPQAQVWEARTMEEAIFDTHWQVRFYALGISLFSTVALVLALTGVFGIVDYGITRQRREFATRVAVGADPKKILSMVLRRSVAMTSVGIGAGLVMTLLVMRFLSGILFGVNPTDLGVYGLSVAMLLGAALVAAYLPARRILRLDPMIVLREE